MKKLLIGFLTLSYLVLLAGLGLAGTHFYFNHQAANGGGIPAQAELKTIQGKVLAGHDVTLETKRRRGVDSVERFYEFDVQPASGEMLKLRVDHSIEQARLEPILDETINAQYDSSDENVAYDILMNNQPVITYQEMAAKAQARADKKANFFGDGAMLQAGIWWIVLGAIGLFIRHKLQISLVKNTPRTLTAPEIAENKPK